MTVLPAIRSRVGDWTFYTTAMTFPQVEALISEPDQIHKRAKLSTWIQRELIESHAEGIADYIKGNEQRFLGSLIIGVYGGEPDWGPLSLGVDNDLYDITEADLEALGSRLGILTLNGDEKRFPIDGQHRVVGVGRALATAEGELKRRLEGDSVSALFVAHDPDTEEGRQRTRRLFTTVNKKAKHVSKTAKIALDEDDGFAITTRRLIDTHWLFEDDRSHISYDGRGSIPADHPTLITSIVTVHDLVKDLHPKEGKGAFGNSRPSDRALDHHLAYSVQFLDLLLEGSEELQSVLVDKTQDADEFRTNDFNYMLLRPIGQRVFARAAQVLVHRGRSLPDAVALLFDADLDLTSPAWHHILWNPVTKNMITAKVAIAESQLLRLIGEEARSATNRHNLDIFLQSRAEA